MGSHRVLWMTVKTLDLALSDMEASRGFKAGECCDLTFTLALYGEGIEGTRLEAGRQVRRPLE